MLRQTTLKWNSVTGALSLTPEQERRGEETGQSASEWTETALPAALVHSEAKCVPLVSRSMTGPVQ